MTESIAFKTTMEFAYGEPAPMCPGIVRLVAKNPGPFTFKGTNTYLLGTHQLALIDPGPDMPAHREAIMTAAAGRPITHIFITHAHRDHVDGVYAVKDITGAATYGFGRDGAHPSSRTNSPSGTDFIDYGFEPDVRLAHEDCVSGEDWTLQALHTPGHAPDHLCLALDDRRVLFTGDHVMSWNTTVVAPPEGRMVDYLASLENMLDRRDRLYLPGHGGRMETPLRMVKAYLVHRRVREQSVLAAIREGAATIPEVAAVVYRGLDARLNAAAELSVLAHVEHLAERGLVTCEGSPALDRRVFAV